MNEQFKSTLENYEKNLNVILILPNWIFIIIILILIFVPMYFGLLFYSFGGIWNFLLGSFISSAGYICALYLCILKDNYEKNNRNNIQ